MKKVFFTTLFALLYAVIGVGSTHLNIVSVLPETRCEVLTVDSTVYGANKGECDSDPFTTASGLKIDTIKLNTGKLRFVALAQPMLKKNGGMFSYGDTITIESNNWRFSGKFIVADCKNKRYIKSIDFLKPGHHFKKGRKGGRFCKYKIPYTVNIIL